MDLLTRVRAVAGAVEGTSTQSREIATAEGSIRYRVTSYCAASVGTNSLIISEEEQFALDNRPPDAAAKLVIGEWVLPLRRILKIVSGIEVLIAVVFVGRTVEGVGATLAHRDDDRTAGFSIFR